VRKGFEVYFTFLVELLWSKQRILEVYMNIIELGEGVYGTEAASQKYFKTSALRLNKNQAALLAVTLPNPIKLKAHRPTSYLQSRQRWAINQMHLFGGTNYLHKKMEDKEKK